MYLREAIPVIAVYILCHGLTTWLVVPLQRILSPDIVLFACLFYLPHGVRVLSVWLLRWRALPALMAGAFISELLFTPGVHLTRLQPVLPLSIAVGAFTTLAAFELLRLFRIDLYASDAQTISWKCLLLAGAIASVFNSLGQTLVFSGFIYPGDQIPAILIYAVGDLTGLFVDMFVLMWGFRFLRRTDQHRRMRR